MFQVEPLLQLPLDTALACEYAGRALRSTQEGPRQLRRKHVSWRSLWSAFSLCGNWRNSPRTSFKLIGCRGRHIVQSDETPVSLKTGFCLQNAAFYPERPQGPRPRGPVAAGVWAEVLAAIMATIAGGPAMAVDQMLTRQHCVTVWNTDDGLPDNTVVTVARSADGYLWIGTSDGGVARFNGVEFRRIDATDAQGNSHLRVHRLIRDERGRPWVSFLTGDVGVVQGKAIVIDRPGGADTLSWWLHEPLGEHAGSHWFSTNLGDLVRRSVVGDSTSWTLISTPGPGTLTLRKTMVVGADDAIMGTDSEGKAWASSAKNVVRFRLKRMHDPARSSASPMIGMGRCGQARSTGSLPGTEMDSPRLPPTPTVKIQALAGLAIMPVSDGGLWVLFAGSLRKYREGRWEATAHPWNERLLAAVSPKRHSPHADDREGGVWIVHRRRGAVARVRDRPARGGDCGSGVSQLAGGMPGDRRRGQPVARARAARPRAGAAPAIHGAAGQGREGRHGARAHCPFDVRRFLRHDLAHGAGGALWKTTADAVEQVAGPVSSAIYNTSVVAPRVAAASGWRRSSRRSFDRKGTIAATCSARSRSGPSPA